MERSQTQFATHSHLGVSSTCAGTKGRKVGSKEWGMFILLGIQEEQEDITVILKLIKIYLLVQIPNFYI